MDHSALNFVVVGASRAGTTTLYGLLGAHPEIYLNPKKKELDFFCFDSNYNKGDSFYGKYFQDRQGKIAGDVSPQYFPKGVLKDKHNRHCVSDFDSCRRIFEFNPQTKIIITLRNPVDRLFSMYNKNLMQGKFNTSLSRMIRDELSGKSNIHNSRYPWIHYNLYSIHVGHYLSVFPKENVKVIVFEEWIKDLNQINDVARFLGVAEFDFQRVTFDKNAKEKYEQRRSSLFKWFHAQRTKWNGETDRGPIRDALREDVKKVRELLNMDLSCWKDFK